MKGTTDTMAQGLDHIVKLSAARKVCHSRNGGLGGLLRGVMVKAVWI